MGLALLILLLQGIKNSLSALSGGLVYWLPSSLFIARLSFFRHARAATRFFVAFLTGEAIKLLLCSILFLFIVKYGQADLLYALIGLSGAIIAYWISSVVTLIQSGGKTC